MIVAKGNKRSVIWYVVMTIAVFCFTYQFRLEVFGFPDWFHSVRFGALLIYAVYAFDSFISSLRVEKDGTTFRFYRTLITIHVLLFLYMLFLYVTVGIQDGEHMVTVLINFFVIRIIPIYLSFKIFRNLKEFLLIVVASTLLQTVFIWASLVNPGIATTFDLLFNDIEYFEGHRSGYAGGLGCITAPGYIRYSLGQIACFYLLAKNRTIIYFALLLLLILTGTLIARTGIFAGSIVILFVIHYVCSYKGKRAIMTIGIVSLVIMALSVQLLSNKTISSFFNERYYRMSSLAEDSRDQGFLNSGFFNNYLHGEDSSLPDLSLETIVGTGVPSGVAGNGVRVNIDGGYLRLYVAYGLILALFFYFFLFRSMIRLSLKANETSIRYTLLLTVIMLILAEYKEWAFYSSPFIWFFTASSFFASKERIDLCKQ